MNHLSPHQDHSNSKDIKINTINRIHEMFLVIPITVDKKTLGNSRRSSKSNSTNKIARKKKGDLKE